MAKNAGVLNISGVRQFLCPGSPDAWSDYPSLSPSLRDALDSMLTPSALKSLYFHPDSFQKVYGLQNARFEEIPIFRINSSSAEVRATELQGFTFLEQGGSLVDTLETEAQRSAYRSVFENARLIVSRNRCVAIHSVRSGNTQAIESLTNMGFSFAMHRDRETSHMTLKGFYPYYSARDDALGEDVFFFEHAELDVLVTVSAPFAEREHGLNFILTHGVLHTFDKVCARCGKTGGLLKCKCKLVRYCCVECQRTHWPSHKAECRMARTNKGGAADV